MFPTMIVLATLAIGPPWAFQGGADFTYFQGPSYSWSFADRDRVFGFGSDATSEWSYGELRVRQQPVWEFPVPRMYDDGGYGGGGYGGRYEFGGGTRIEIPDRAPGWRPRRKIKFKMKDGPGLFR